MSGYSPSLGRKEPDDFADAGRDAVQLAFVANKCRAHKVARPPMTPTTTVVSLLSPPTAAVSRRVDDAIRLFRKEFHSRGWASTSSRAGTWNLLPDSGTTYTGFG